MMLELNVLDTGLSTKVCSKCKEIKVLSEFHKSRKIKCGFKSQCKNCTKFYYEYNREKVLDRQKLYYESNKELLSEKARKYYIENKQHHVATQKEWLDANKEKVSLYSKKYREENRELQKIRVKKCYEQKKDLYLDNAKKWREANKDRVITNNKIWYQKNSERQKTNIKNWELKNKDYAMSCRKKWRDANRGLCREKTARYRSKKNLATPVWISDDQILAIKSIYKKAVELEKLDGVKRGVDHIHPINSKYICGMHLPNNLQILTASQNSIKYNKFESYTHSDLDTNNLKSWEVL